MPLSFPSGYTPSLLPAIATSVRFGVGTSPASSDYKPVFLGNKTSAGLATVAVPVEVSGPEDADTQFGARSELAKMLRAWFLIAPRGRVWACAVAENGSGVAATATLLFATTATANGVVRIRINGRRLPEVVITSGDTASTVASAVEAMLDLYTDLPCTAGVSTATVTLTAAQVGPRGNNLRIVCEIVPSGTSAVAMTVALNGGSAATKVDGRFGTDSATAGSGADDFTAAIAAVNTGDYDFVVGACSDDTNRGLISTHVTSASAISEGRRRVGICGSLTSTLSGSGSVAEDAQGHNNVLMRVIHLKGAHNTTGELAAAYCAAHIYGDGVRKGIAQYTAANQDGLQLAPAIWAPEVTDYTTNAQRAALLAAGVTPCVASFANPGYAQLVRPVTTRTQALSGATSYLVIDPSKVTVSFEVADRWETFCAENYAGKNLAPDPSDPDNTPSNEDVIWPAAMREDVLALLRTMEDEGKLVNVNAHADDVVVEASESDNTVALVVIPVAVIPHLHSIINTVNQVG